MVVFAGFLWSNSSFQGEVPEGEGNRRCTDRSHHLAPRGPGEDGWRPGRGGGHPARSGQAATGEDHGWRLPCSLPWLSVPVTAPREPPLPGPWVQALPTPSSPWPLLWPVHAADHSRRDAVRFWVQPEASLVASAPALAEPRAVPREAWLPGSRGPRGRASQGSRGPGKNRGGPRKPPAGHSWGPRPLTPSHPGWARHLSEAHLGHQCPVLSESLTPRTVSKYGQDLGSFMKQP